MNFVTIEQDGSITVAARNVDEARLALQDLKFQKKAVNLQKKEVNEQMRQIRASYTDTESHYIGAKNFTSDKVLHAISDDMRNLLEAYKLNYGG